MAKAQLVGCEHGPDIGKCEICKRDGLMVARALEAAFEELGITDEHKHIEALLGLTMGKALKLGYPREHMMQAAALYYDNLKALMEKL